MGIFNFFGKKKKEAKRKEAEPTAEERKGGFFAASILLDEVEVSIDKFIEDLKNDWGIEVTADVSSKSDDTMAFDIDGMTAAFGLMPAPVPNGEAVENAKTNYRWPEAVTVAQGHKAHLFVAVLPGEHSFAEAGIAMVKVCTCALKQEHATGIYTVGTVMSPDFYTDFANVYLQNDMYPIMNLVFFGLYSRDNGKTFCSYTYGLKDSFGKDEIEVIDSEHQPQELLEFMADIAAYVVEDDVLLQDGETIGFTEEQKLPITKSKSEVLDGETLKIGF